MNRSEFASLLRLSKIVKLDAHLELGRRMGGSKQTLRNAHAEAVRTGRATFICSPRVKKLAALGRKLGIDAKVWTSENGFTYVRVEP